MKRTKTIEVIATRDEGGRFEVWDVGTNMLSGQYWWNADTSSKDGRITGGTRAKELIGGTYCGIRKGGMKRLRITTTVEAVTV